MVVIAALKSRYASKGVKIGKHWSKEPMKHYDSGQTQEGKSVRQALVSTVDAEKEIGTFLAALGHGTREGFLSFVENNESIYEIWLYAGVVGYEGGFESLEAWVKKRYPKLNRRQLLLAEIIRLQSDIENVRTDETIKSENVASRIAQLSKELRGHIVEVEKMNRSIDRRGLTLAGADRTMRLLREMFCKDGAMTETLSEAFHGIWAQLLSEN